MTNARDVLGPQWAADRMAARLQTGPRVNIQSLPVANIEGDPEQPRKHFDEAALRELGESLRDHKQLQPIRVRPAGTAGRYIVVAGERRLRASKLVGLEYIDAIVLSDRVDVDTVRVEQAIENLQREQLSPLEEAEHYARLLTAWGCSQAELARKLRKGAATISRALALLSPAEDKPAPKRQRRRVAGGDKRRAATYETKAAGTVRVKRGYSLEQLVDELRQALEAERLADAA